MLLFPVIIPSELNVTPFKLSAFITKILDNPPTAEQDKLIPFNAIGVQAILLFIKFCYFIIKIYNRLVSFN